MPGEALPPEVTAETLDHLPEEITVGEVVGGAEEKEEFLHFADDKYEEEASNKQEQVDTLDGTAKEVEDDISAMEVGAGSSPPNEDVEESNPWWEDAKEEEEINISWNIHAKYGGETAVEESHDADGDASSVVDEVIPNINSEDESDESEEVVSERWQTFDTTKAPPPTPNFAADDVDANTHDLARAHAILKEGLGWNVKGVDAGKQTLMPTLTTSSGNAGAEKSKTEKTKKNKPMQMRPPLVITATAHPLPKLPPKKSPAEERADAHAAKVEESVAMLLGLVSSISTKPAHRVPWMEPAAVVPDAWIKALTHLQGDGGHAAAVAEGRCPDDRPKSSPNRQVKLNEMPSFTARGIVEVQSQLNLLSPSKEDLDPAAPDLSRSTPTLPKLVRPPKRSTLDPGLGITDSLRPSSDAETEALEQVDELGLEITNPLDTKERDALRASPTPGLILTVSPKGGSLARGNNAAARRRREEVAAFAAAAAAAGKFHKTAAAAAKAAAEAYKQGQVKERARPASAGFLIHSITNGPNLQRVPEENGVDNGAASTTHKLQGHPAGQPPKPSVSPPLPEEASSIDEIKEYMRDVCPSCLTARVGGGYIAIGFPGERTVEEELKFPDQLPPCRDCGRELDYSIATGERLCSPRQTRLHAERAAIAASKAARLRSKLADLRSGKTKSLNEADALEALAKALKLAAQRKADELAFGWRGDRGDHGFSEGAANGVRDGYRRSGNGGSDDNGSNKSSVGSDDSDDDLHDDSDDDLHDDSDDDGDWDDDGFEMTDADRVMKKYKQLGLWRAGMENGKGHGEHSTLEEVLLRPTKVGENRGTIYAEARLRFQRKGCILVFKLHITGAKVPGLVSPVATHAAIVYLRACFRLRLWSRSGINAPDGATLVKAEGSRLFAFANTVEAAVMAGYGAMHICRKMSEKIPEVTARVSVALSSGTVILVDEDDFYGNPVLTATRMSGPDVAIPDEVVCSEDCFSTIIDGGLRLERRTDCSKKSNFHYGVVSFPLGTGDDVVKQALGVYAEQLPADSAIRTICGVHDASPSRILLRLVPIPPVAGRFASIVAAAAVAPGKVGAGGLNGSKHTRWLGAAKKAQTTAPQITAASAPDALVNTVTRTLTTTGVVVQVMLAGFSKLVSKYGVLHFLTLVLHLRRIVRDKLEEHHCTLIRVASEKTVLWFESIEFAVQHIDSIRTEVLAFNEKVVGTNYWPGGGEIKSDTFDDYTLNVTISASYGDFIVLGTDIFGNAWDECKYLTEKAGKEGHVVVSPHFEAEFTLRNNLKDDYMEKLHCVFVRHRAVAPTHEERRKMALHRRNAVGPAGGADASAIVAGAAGRRRSSIAQRRASSTSNPPGTTPDSWNGGRTVQTPPMRVRRGSLPHSGKLLGVEVGGMPEHYRMLMHYQVDSDAEESDSDELSMIRHSILHSRMSVVATHEFATTVTRGATGSTHFHHAGGGGGGGGGSSDGGGGGGDRGGSRGGGSAEERRRMRMEKLSKMSRSHLKTKRAKMQGDQDAEDRDEKISEMISDIMMFGD